MTSEVADEGSPVYEFEVDQRCAFMIFDALERGVVHAAQAEEMDVAADYLDTLFLLQTQDDELTEDYHDVLDEIVQDERGAFEVEAFYAALSEVKRWAHEEGHDVGEWFDEEVDDGK